MPHDSPAAPRAYYRAPARTSSRMSMATSNSLIRFPPDWITPRSVPSMPGCETWAARSTRRSVTRRRWPHSNPWLGWKELSRRSNPHMPSPTPARWRRSWESARRSWSTCRGAGTRTCRAWTNMSRLSSAFDRIRAEKRTGLVTYVTAGDPDLARSAEILQALDRAGADVLEVGIPFSEPLADGPVIQRATERALAAGGSLRETLALIGSVRQHVRAPIVVFSYANPLFRMGLKTFAE